MKAIGIQVKGRAPSEMSPYVMNPHEQPYPDEWERNEKDLEDLHAIHQALVDLLKELVDAMEALLEREAMKPMRPVNDGPPEHEA